MHSPELAKELEYGPTAALVFSAMERQREAEGETEGEMEGRRRGGEGRREPRSKINKIWRGS